MAEQGTERGGGLLLGSFPPLPLPPVGLSFGFWGKARAAASAAQSWVAASVGPLLPLYFCNHWQTNNVRGHTTLRPLAATSFHCPHFCKTPFGNKRTAPPHGHARYLVREYCAFDWPSTGYPRLAWRSQSF